MGLELLAAAYTRWRFDQHFSRNTHSPRKRPPPRAAPPHPQAARVSAISPASPSQPLAVNVRLPPGHVAGGSYTIPVAG